MTVVKQRKIIRILSKISNYFQKDIKKVLVSVGQRLAFMHFSRHIMHNPMDFCRS